MTLDFPLHIKPLLNHWEHIVTYGIGYQPSTPFMLNWCIFMESHEPHGRFIFLNFLKNKIYIKYASWLYWLPWKSPTEKVNWSMFMRFKAEARPKMEPLNFGTSPPPLSCHIWHLVCGGRGGVADTCIMPLIAAPTPPVFWETHESQKTVRTGSAAAMLQ